LHTNIQKVYLSVLTLRSFLQFGQQWLCLVSHPKTQGAWKECPQVSSHTIVGPEAAGCCSSFASPSFDSVSVEAVPSVMSVKQMEQV